MRKIFEYLLAAMTIVLVVLGIYHYIEYDANRPESVWGIEDEEWETYSENGFVKSRPVPWYKGK